MTNEEIQQWADSHETSEEIATVIHRRYPGIEDHVFENISDSDKGDVLAAAWELADENEDTLYWGLDSYSR